MPKAKVLTDDAWGPWKRKGEAPGKGKMHPDSGDDIKGEGNAKGQGKMEAALTGTGSVQSDPDPDNLS